jgi:hypothetical protein
VGDYGPVHADVIIITEIQNFFSSDLSVIVDDDRVRDLKTENDILDKIHSLLGANFGRGVHLDQLGEFIESNEQVGQAPGCLLEGP